jgi:hypothetical protein
MVVKGLMKLKKPVEEASYIVFTDGSKYYAKNGSTGMIEYSSSNMYDVMKYVFNNAPDNSFIVFKLNRPYIYIKPKYVSSGYDLTQLTFKIKKIIRSAVPYDDPQLFIPILDQRFTYSGDSALVTPIAEWGSITLSIGNGTATLTGPSSGDASVAFTYNIDTVPYLLVIVAEVDSWSGTLGSTRSNPYIDIIKDSNNLVQWVYDVLEQRFKTYRKVNGTPYYGEIYASVAITPPFKLIVAVNGRSALFFYEKDNKLVYVGMIKNVGFDWNDPSVWSQFKIGFGAYLPANQWVAFRRFKVVYAPIGGARDPCIVTDKYGAPLIINGRIFFTATIATEGEDIPSAGYALFSLDTSTYDVRLEKVLVTKRVDLDNKLYGDHAGHLIYDPDTGKFIALISAWVSSSWTSTNMGVLLGFSDMNLNERGVQIIEAKMISDLVNHYDPFAVFDSDTKKWRIASVVWKNKIYVHENNVMDYSGWTQIAFLDLSNLTAIVEGTRIIKVNGKWYIAMGKGDVPSWMTATDYPTLQNNYTINAPTLSGTAGAPPHPTIVPIPIGTKTKYIIITMDRTLPRGNLVIMEADQMNSGYEYPLLIFA